MAVFNTGLAIRSFAAYDTPTSIMSRMQTTKVARSEWRVRGRTKGRNVRAPESLFLSSDIPSNRNLVLSRLKLEVDGNLATGPGAVTSSNCATFKFELRHEKNRATRRKVANYKEFAVYVTQDRCHTELDAALRVVSRTSLIRSAPPYARAMSTVIRLQNVGLLSEDGTGMVEPLTRTRHCTRTQATSHAPCRLRRHLQVGLPRSSSRSSSSPPPASPPHVSQAAVCQWLAVQHWQPARLVPCVWRLSLKGPGSTTVTKGLCGLFSSASVASVDRASSSDRVLVPCHFQPEGVASAARGATPSRLGRA
jgi:hypothetical protein